MTQNAFVAILLVSWINFICRFRILAGLFPLHLILVSCLFLSYFSVQGVGASTIDPAATYPLGGLFQCCYLPDRMNVILSDAFFKNNVSTVHVSTQGDTFQIDQLVTAKNFGMLVITTRSLTVRLRIDPRPLWCYSENYG